MIVEHQVRDDIQATRGTHDVSTQDRSLRALPFIVDNPIVAVVIAFVAGALAGSQLPGRGLITRAARMLLMRELGHAVTAAL